MASGRGGLNDDADEDQSIVSLARKSVSQQRNNGTPNGPGAAPDEVPSPSALPTTAKAAEPTGDERRVPGRPRNPRPRRLLRATVSDPNYEWVERMWRTQIRADGSRYANMGEFIDELVSLARAKTDV